MNVTSIHQADHCASEIHAVSELNDRFSVVIWRSGARCAFPATPSAAVRRPLRRPAALMIEARLTSLGDGSSLPDQQ
jgi:hypothetical protein